MLLLGLLPSKTLIRPGDVLAAARRVLGAAEAVTGSVDATAAFTQRDSMVSNWSDAGQEEWQHDEGIELIRGRGRLTGERRIDVDTDGAGDATRSLTAVRAVVIATGTSPAVPPIEGLSEAAPWDNRDVTAAKELPRRLLVLGGGAIGAEMAQAFKRLGCEEVTLVEGRDRLLANEEPFAGDELRAAFEEEGITVITGAKVTAVHRDKTDGPVTTSLDDGRELAADEILVAVGRRSNTTDIGLDTVGLGDLAGHFLAVDERLRVRGIDGSWLYAVGDCNGLALLTHMGKHQARQCGDVILGKDATDVADDGIVPRVTFTDPQGVRGGAHRAPGSGGGDQRSGADLRHRRRGRRLDHGHRRLRHQPAGGGRGPPARGGRHLHRARRPGAAALATRGHRRTGPVERLWHAVPAFPTVSEVWLRLLEAYGL